MTARTSVSCYLIDGNRNTFLCAKAQFYDNWNEHNEPFFDLSIKIIPRHRLPNAQDEHSECINYKGHLELLTSNTLFLVLLVSKYHTAISNSSHIRIISNAINDVARMAHCIYLFIYVPSVYNFFKHFVECPNFIYLEPKSKMPIHKLCCRIFGFGSKALDLIRYALIKIWWNRGGCVIFAYSWKRMKSL